VAHGAEPICPFCLGREKDEQELFRIGGQPGDSNWQVRVIPNKFPFAPIHEIVIHSADHHKNFSELPLSQVELIFQAYKNRFQTNIEKGQVIIFNNHGEAGGESLPHPHTQIAVVPADVTIDIPRLEEGESGHSEEKALDTGFFGLYCPHSSQWPDEVWIVPKRRGRSFGEITEEEVKELAILVQKLIAIMAEEHGHEFPFNFYIYPAGDWYLRFMPRTKSIGGFEISTGIFVNTKDPAETIIFLREKLQM
jgi:UDPglucose--hexose-1-phosphate uridylyltransferase